MGINPVMSGVGLRAAQATQVTPFGFATATVDGLGPGSVQIGQFGVASSLSGPLPITPANTANSLGLASPFATPFGSNNPIGFNSFGAQNPFSPLGLTPTSGFNPLPFGSFGPNPNPLSPLSGSSNPAAWMGTNALTGQAGFGNMFTSALGIPQAGQASAFSGGLPFPTAQPNFDTRSFFGLLQSGFGSWMLNQLNQLQSGMQQWMGNFGFPVQSIPGIVPQQAIAPGFIPQPGFSTLPQQSFNPGFVSPGFASPAAFGVIPQQGFAPGFIPPQTGFGFMPQQSFSPGFATPGAFGVMPQQGFSPGFIPQTGFSGGMSVPGVMTPNGFIPMQSPQGFVPIQTPQGMMMSPIPSVPMQGLVNPFAQQMAMMGNMGGTGGRLVSPLGTFITSIGPMGGNANAGFLGTQAAGQAMALALSPINPAMIVNYSNPMYSRFNFNTGFFAA